MSQQGIAQTTNAQNTVQQQNVNLLTTQQTIAPTIDGWELYPEGLDAFNPFECDAFEARKRLSDQSISVFSDINIWVDFIDTSGRQSATLSCIGPHTDEKLAATQFRADRSTFRKDEDVVNHIRTTSSDLRIMYDQMIPTLIQYADLCQIHFAPRLITTFADNPRASSQDPHIPRHWLQVSGPDTSVSSGQWILRER